MALGAIPKCTHVHTTLTILSGLAGPAPARLAGRPTNPYVLKCSFSGCVDHSVVTDRLRCKLTLHYPAQAAPRQPAPTTFWFLAPRPCYPVITDSQWAPPHTHVQWRTAAGCRCLSAIFPTPPWKLTCGPFSPSLEKCEMCTCRETSTQSAYSERLFCFCCERNRCEQLAVGRRAAQISAAPPPATPSRSTQTPAWLLLHRVRG